ncbi:Retrovirus-related Pol polyprotein from transposon 297 Protease [Channa argus]|uniref:ribonuclease H n=1 Tax=Channa argus TaxID=215402 RepID=A0A6G1Q5S8_CHAAH|nr:Retrovirus-related Pol polyprotein from transposon 297 Protease [Channa argus]
MKCSSCMRNPAPSQLQCRTTVESNLENKKLHSQQSADFIFKVMAMGLTNAPATGQRLMEMVLRGLPWKTCLVYLDDVLIYSRSFSQHLQHLEEILSRFQSSGLKLNPSKCCYATDRVQFLELGFSTKQSVGLTKPVGLLVFNFKMFIKNIYRFLNIFYTF